MSIKITEIMTANLITVNTIDGLDESYLKMKKNGVRHLPVIDFSSKVVGIISDRDFQRAMRSYESKATDFNPDEKVRDYMTSSLIEVSYDAELLLVVQKMIDQKVSAILISKNQTSIGIITNEDLLKILADLLRPTEDDGIEKVQGWLYNSPIGEIASRLANIGI